MKILPSFLVTTFLFGAVAVASADADQAKTKQTREERIAARFDAMDSDDNGVISRAEFVAAADARHDKRLEPGKKGKHAKKAKAAKHAKKVKQAKKAKRAKIAKRAKRATANTSGAAAKTL